MNEPGPEVEEPLLVEHIAALFGFEWLAGRLPGNIYPPYLFLLVFVIFDLGIVNSYIHFAGYATYILVDQPYIVAAPIALFLAAIGIRYLSGRYAEAVASLPLHDIDENDLEAFGRIVPFRAKLVVYGIAVVGMYVNIIGNVGLDNVIATEGAPTLVNWLFVWQAVYIPFMVEFVLMFLGIHVLLPRRIAKADIPMFFYDPLNMGGFAPVGQLLKHSYYLYTAGLLLYFVMTYGPILFSFGGTVVAEPGLVSAIFFSTAWFIGVAAIAFSMLTMHQVMADKKHQRISELKEEIEEIIVNPYDINNSEVTSQEKLDDFERRLNVVRDTRVYPASFTMWSQIAVSVLLPQALNMAVQTVA